MRYYKYLTEEDIVSKALSLGEPKVGRDYAPEKVKRYLNIIEDALNAMKKREENEANDAIVTDLRNKKKAWKNVDKETKPVKTKLEVPPEQEQDQEEEQPPPQQQQQQPPPQQEEGWLFRFIDDA